MNLDLAVLNVLVASKRAIPASVITAAVPEFTGREETQTDVVIALKRLERAGDAKGTDDQDRGILWKETPDGRLRVL